MSNISDNHQYKFEHFYLTYRWFPKLLEFDITNKLIGMIRADRPSSPIRIKVECCRSRAYCDCRITDLLSRQNHVLKLYGSPSTANRQSVGALNPSAEMQSTYSTAPD